MPGHSRAVASRAVASMVAFLAAVSPGACGPQAADRGHADAARDSGRSSTVAAANPQMVTVVAKDFSFDAPTQIPAGVTAVRLVNQGHELHHVTFIQLDDGKTAADLAAAISKPGPAPSWTKSAGGPNTVVPGGTGNATLILEPGNYVMVCLIQGADNVPHMAKGMMRPLTVTASIGASGSAATEPTADITFGLTEYSFALTPAPTRGGHTIRVDNNGKQGHEVVLLRLMPGKTTADLMAWMQKSVGPPPVEPLGGIAPLSPGRHGYFTADLTPGSYVALCFVGDDADGKPHFAHGMIKTFTIT